MNTPTLFSESHRATYCPEDDKLRLYVGRVPREEYLALKSEGWTSTPKQDCDFVAVWTVSRKRTAESYAGIIEDEDAGPEGRAADRAERFSGYLDKRLNEAIGHADRYDAGPSAHGYQNKGRAVRAADRHDRIATRATDAWDKAEYWQSRTAGVIDHALYKSSPAVRMGRIKTLEAELRKAEKELEDRARNFRNWQKLAAIADPATQTEKVLEYVGHDNQWSNYRHPRAENLSKYYQENDVSLYSLCSHETAPITGAEACAFFFSDHREPGIDTEFIRHLKLRLAYEFQMLDAQGGRAALIEMEVGGWIGGKQIYKINKSPATDRVVSVGLRVRTHGQDIYGNPEPKAPEFRLTCTNIERLSESSYRPPTEEERQSFSAAVKAEKAARPKSTAPALINPTLEDAQRLQDMINQRNLADWIRKHGTQSKYHKAPDPKEVTAITQATYSANSSGSYARAETRGLCGNGELESPSSNMWSNSEEVRRKRIGPILCKIRITGYDPVSIIHITDKPAKPLPAVVWQQFAPAHTPESLKPQARELVAALQARSYERTKEQEEVITAGRVAGLCGTDQMNETGHTWARETGAYSAPAPLQEPAAEPPAPERSLATAFADF